MLAINQCLEALRSAPDERAVHVLLTECLSQIADELSTLPPEVRLVLANRDSEIHEIAVNLLQTELAFAGDENAKMVLWRIAHLFAGAASRIGHIRARVHRQRT